MEQEARRRLVKQIHEAFKDVPKPDFVGVYLEDLQGVSWESVSVFELRSHADELHQFTPEGFRYFLPAILTAVILHSDDADVLVDNIIHALVPEEDNLKSREAVERSFRNYIDTLDDNERKAITDSLNLHADEFDKFAGKMLTKFKPYPDPPEYLERHKREFKERVQILDAKMKKAVATFVLSYEALEPQSGVIYINRELYEKAVEFWSAYA